jgi:hypothetical protein
MPFPMHATFRLSCDVLLGRRDMERSLPQDMAQGVRNGVEWN